jgi:hypothetical protein
MAPRLPELCPTHSEPAVEALQGRGRGFCWAVVRYRCGCVQGVSAPTEPPRHDLRRPPRTQRAPKEPQ